MSQLLEWLQFVSIDGTKRRLITVVSKADLWWDQRKDVLIHYESGEYGKIIKKHHDVLHAVTAYCSVIKMHFDRGALAAGFDENVKRSLRKAFIEQLLSIPGLRE